jgi:hypothetical protein
MPALEKPFSLKYKRPFQIAGKEVRKVPVYLVDLMVTA